MYPKDNIFNIFYNIGRITPFQVKRCEQGLVRSLPQNRYKPTGRTFIVERVEPKGKYGKAYGYCLVDGVRSDEYLKYYNPDYDINDIAEIPCAGCGEWVLIDVPGKDLSEIFPIHKADEQLAFGKYKGKTFADIYSDDPQYIYWLMDTDPYFKVDILGIIGKTPSSDEERTLMLEEEYKRIFPEISLDTVLSFGKYKGKSLAEIKEIDSNYFEWLVRNNIEIR